jgi:putative membrane protein insertion efficiency factor
MNSFSSWLKCLFFFYIMTLCTIKGEGQSIKSDTSLFVGSILNYQRFFSPIIGGNCAMYPSCSNYALEAFRRTNTVLAFIFTTDRLMRCGRDLNRYKSIYTSSGFLYNDPLDEFNHNRIENPIIYMPDTVNVTSHYMIEFLMRKGFYHEALLEINKVFFNKRNYDQIEFYKDYLIILRELKEYKIAYNEYQMKFPENIRSNPLIKFEIGKTFLNQNEYDQAIEYFTLDDNSIKDTLQLSKSLMFLGYSHACQNNWEQAISLYRKVPHNSIYYSNSLKNINILNEGKTQRYKRPGLAGTLGVIPGLGYLYAAHPQTAVTALLSNTLFFYATYTSWKSKNYGIAILTGFVSLSFYTGNIMGSARSAVRYNNIKRNLYLNRLSIE